MIVGIDFDGTYSEDPLTFSKIIDIFHNAGHECIMVTQRSDDYEWGNEIRRVLRESGKKDLPVIFASGETKMGAAKREGYMVDVWIDDNPYGIFTPLVFVGESNASTD